MTDAMEGLGGHSAETVDARRQRRQLRAEYGMGRMTLEELETALAELDSRDLTPAEQEDTDDATDH